MSPSSICLLRYWQTSHPHWGRDGYVIASNSSILMSYSHQSQELMFFACLRWADGVAFCFLFNQLLFFQKGFFLNPRIRLYYNDNSKWVQRIISMRLKGPVLCRYFDSVFFPLSLKSKAVILILSAALAFCLHKQVGETDSANGWRCLIQTANSWDLLSCIPSPDTEPCPIHQSQVFCFWSL